jgi:hypothetical protein
MPIENNYNNTSNVTPIAVTGPQTVTPVQVTSVAPVVQKKTVSSGTLGAIPNPAPPVPPQNTATAIPDGPYIGPIIKQPEDVTPGVATGTTPPTPQIKVPISSNTEVTSNAIPQPTPNASIGTLGVGTQPNLGNVLGNTTNIYNTYLGNVKVYDANVLITNSVSAFQFVGNGVNVTGGSTAIVTITATAAGAGGANSQVQYNDNGVLGGNPGLVFIESNTTLISNNFKATSSANLGNVGNVRIFGGSNNYVLSTDGAGNLSWKVGGGGGNGTPAGNDTQVQYNNNGSFGANANFTFGASTGQLNVPGNVVVGNAIGGNLTGANVVFSNSFTSNGGVVDFATNNPNVKLGNIANIHIGGGSNGQAIITDGTGNLTWGNASGGNANVAGTNTQVQFNDNGVMGANANLTFDKTKGNLTVGSNVVAVNFIGSGANTPTILSGTNLDLIATAAVRVPSNISLYGANVSLGSISNLHVTGGSNGQAIITDGAGNLRWGNAGGGGANAAGNTYEVQFKAANGNFAASNSFVFNPTVATANGTIGTLKLKSDVNYTIPGDELYTIWQNSTGGNTWAMGMYSNGYMEWYNHNDGGTGGAGGNGSWSVSPTGNFNIAGNSNLSTYADAAGLQLGTDLRFTFNGNAANGNHGIYFADNTYQYTAATSPAVQDEGSNVVTSASIFNFVGNGVVASNVGGIATITIPGNDGNGNPGGANSQVQYNDNGIFGGNPAFTFDEGNTLITANNFVATSTANLGNVGNVTILGGSANYVLTTDGSGHLSWNSGSGLNNVAAGGANTQVQYNDNGILGGNPAFTFDEGTTLITANNLTVSSITRLGPVGNVHITGGNNGYYLQTDGTGNLTWATGSNYSGNGTVAGSNTQVQFNNAGNFGANAGFTFVSTTGWLRAPGNISANSELHFGYDQDFANNNDAWGRLRMFNGVSVNGSPNLNSAYGFTYQNTGSGNAYLALTNEERNWNQAFIIADGSLGPGVGNVPVTAFGFSVNDTGTSSNPTTGQEPGWLPLLNLDYSGDLTLPGIGNVDTGVANIGGLYVRGKSYLNSVSNITITGGSANYVLTTDGNGHLSWGNLSSASNVGAGGANSQVQYNDNGILGGNPAFTFNEGTTVVTANNLTVSSITRLGNISNVHIDGGNNGYFLQTDGTGNLTWAPASSNSNANSQVAGANTQVQFNDAGSFGAAAGFTYNKISSTLTSNAIVATKSANLGNVGNVYIGGGNANFILTTNGSGNLTWANVSLLSNIAAGGANTQVQYNDNGILGGNPGMTFNESTTTLTANNFVATSKANLGQIANVHIFGGTNGYVLQTDGAGNLSWTAQTGNSANSNGVPGGANTQVQFNDGGVFGAVAGFTFNKTTTTLTANNLVATSKANLGAVANVTITGGSNNFVLATDGSGVLRWANLASNIGNIKAGGANTQVQYNDNGILGGNPAFTFDEANTIVGANNLTISSISRLGPAGNVKITGGSNNYVLTTDGTGNLRWGNGGLVNVAGTNTQVQFNDNGVFGANTGFTFDKSTGWLNTPGNITAGTELHVGIDTGFANATDAWGRIRMFQGTANANTYTAYGFTFQNVSTSNSQLAITNEEGNRNQALILGDGGTDLPGLTGTALGYSILKNANSNATTGQEPGWAPLLNLDYGGNFKLPGIVNGSNVNIPNSGTANVGGLYVRGKSYLNDVSNVTIQGGNPLDFLVTTDGAGNLAWATLDTGAAGANTQVQYNDNGAFGGDPSFTFDQPNTLVTVNNFIVTSTANLGSNANIKITGGGLNQVLTTDGAGNLSWTNGIANAPGGYYLHTQGVASNVWTVTHNLNRTYVVVEPVDTTGNSYNGRYDFPTIHFVNANTLTMTWETSVAGYAAVVGGGISYVGGNTGITVQDEGSNVLANATTMNFVGPSVTASNVGGVATINIAGISGVIVQDEGNVTVASTNTFNFVGGGVTTSNVGGVATVTVPGLYVQDEGTNIVTANVVNFVGNGVTATSSVAGVATVTVTKGISGITVQDEGSNVVTTANTINFVGAGVNTTSVGGVATVNISGGGGNSTAGLPPYIRSYTGGGYIPSNTSYNWYPLPLDNNAIVNDINASDYPNGIVFLQAGTYVFEMSVPIKCEGSDTITSVYTALVENTTSNGLTPIPGSNPNDFAAYGNVIARGSVMRLGDWQTGTMVSTGRFTIPSGGKYLSIAFTQTDSPQAIMYGDPTGLGYSTVMLKLWKQT